MMPIEIILTEQEMLMAAVVGASRHYESYAKGRVNSHGLKLEDSSVGAHIEGAAGEAAVARFLGRYWGGERGTFKAADIGSRLQVRTRSKHTYDLIVRDDDADDHAYVLVTGHAPVMDLRGWLWGHDAKRPEFRKNPGDREEAWFVPASRLKAMKKP